MDNPEEIEKGEEIKEIVPETDEISPKLASADAIVSAFLEECRADIEKNAENTEKNVQNNKESLQNIKNNKESLQNVQNNKESSQNVQTENNEIQNRVKSSQNLHNRSWYFPGEQIRLILRWSMIKTKDLAAAMGISCSKLARLLRSEVFPMEISKKLASLIGLNSPEELQEYYDNIPEEAKDSVRWDARISRMMPPPKYTIPLEVIRAAEALGMEDDVYLAAKRRYE